MGTAALQLAHQAGAYVLGTAGSVEKLEKAAELGLDVGINYKEQDFAQVVRERTEGAGVNVVVDIVGGPYWERNLTSWQCEEEWSWEETRWTPAWAC